MRPLLPKESNSSFMIAFVKSHRVSILSSRRKNSTKVYSEDSSRKLPVTILAMLNCPLQASVERRARTGIKFEKDMAKRTHGELLGFNHTKTESIEKERKRENC